MIGNTLVNELVDLQTPLRVTGAGLREVTVRCDGEAFALDAVLIDEDHGTGESFVAFDCSRPEEAEDPQEAEIQRLRVENEEGHAQNDVFIDIIECLGETSQRLREENAELREKLGSINQKVKDLYGGMGSGRTIWRRSQYDKGYSNAITAALTAIDAAREATE